MARHMVRVASYVIPIRDGKVFLMRRFQTGWMDGLYGLASGHMEAGESPSVAAAREAKEETGIDLKPEDLSCAFVMHRKPTFEGDFEYIDVFFTAKQWTGEPQVMEPDKCDEAEWFPLQSLPENILPYIREVLGFIEKGVSYGEE